jgi:glycosyltransferase involved in cell wall biosynthesis
MRQKIVHVTEALGGGVLHCVALLANRQAAAGDDVVLLHSIRHDTPSPAKLDEVFDQRVRRRVIDMRTSIGPHDAISAVRIALAFICERPDIIHLHSSKAAALGRVAARMLGMARRTLYSPHGFAFLKEDISPRKAKFFLQVERMLHAIGGHIVACSKSELRYARMLLARAERTSLVENAVDVANFDLGSDQRTAGSITICTSARVTYQKAPWRFASLARDISASSNVTFVWFGDGPAEAIDRWIDRETVNVTGWIPASDLRRRLAQCDVFVLPSLWEGMPIALIEAQAAGLPAVASRIVGNRDVIVHGVTGFLANDDEELAHYTRLLINDAGLRRRMGEAAKAHALSQFSDRRLFRSYVGLYRHLLTPAYSSHLPAASAAYQHEVTK